MKDLLLPSFEYPLDESDPGILVVRRQDGTFVSALSAGGAIREGIVEAAREAYRDLVRFYLASGNKSSKD